MRITLARWAVVAVIAPLAALACLSFPAAADVIGTGDVSPEGPIDLPEFGGTVSGDVIVGGAGVDPSEFGILTINVPSFTDPLISDNGFVAATTSTSIGQVTITGVLSEWAVNESMQVGVEGYGTMLIEDGAIVRTVDVTTMFTDEDAKVGVGAAAQGFVTITGLGTRWSHSQLIVGESGFGVVTVQNGARLFSGREARLGTMYDLGNNEIGDGRVTITGQGSRWIVSDDNLIGGMRQLIIGEAGRGEVEALAEGVIRVDGDITLGAASAAYGKARVNGRGSLMWTFADLNVADTAGARADLYVENEGIVRADVAMTVGARGFVNLDGGTVLTPTIANGGVIRGDGTVDIGDSGTLTNTGELRVAASVANIRQQMLITGDVESTMGVVESIGGEMEILGSLTAGEVRILDDGIIRVGGALSFGSTSALTLSLSPNAAAIFAAGGATLAGDLTVDFDFGFNPGVNDVFELISGGPVTGTFATESVPADWEVVYLPDSVLLANSAAPPVFASADFDLDLDVDDVDLAAWEAGFGTSPGAVKGDGDANEDGAVTGADFLQWQREYGFGVPTTPAVAAVPEPHTAALALLAVAGLAMRRRVR